MPPRLSCPEARMRRPIPKTEPDRSQRGRHTDAQALAKSFKTGRDWKRHTMSALGQKQTCAAQKLMSALPPKATMIATNLCVYAGDLSEKV